MSGPPEPAALRRDSWLLRRVGPGKVSRTGDVKASAFNLRPARGERELSFYLLEVGQESLLLRAAPAPDWGVVAVSVGALQDLGFNVEFEPDSNDKLLGDRHVLAQPWELDDAGQIPQATRAALASSARVVIGPANG